MKTPLVSDLEVLRIQVASAEINGGFPLDARTIRKAYIAPGSVYPSTRVRVERAAIQANVGTPAQRRAKVIK